MKEGKKAILQKGPAGEGQGDDLWGLPIIQYVQSLVAEQVGVREGGMVVSEEAWWVNSGHFRKSMSVYSRRNEGFTDHPEWWQTSSRGLKEAGTENESRYRSGPDERRQEPEAGQAYWCEQNEIRKK